MQTLLQRQTSRFGSHVFQEGTIVTGGAKTFNSNIPFVKITDKLMYVNFLSFSMFIYNFNKK